LIDLQESQTSGGLEVVGEESFLRAAGQQASRRELVVAGLVEPRAFDVEEGEAGREAREGERVNRELRDGLVGAGVGLVIEDMNRPIPHLQEIDVPRDESRLMAERRAGAVDRFFGNNRDAVVVFKRREWRS
jgi:hypothetical protein